MDHQCSDEDCPCSFNGARRTALETVLGLTIHGALRDGWEPDGVMLLIRATDSAGRPRIDHLTAGRVMLWELKAMLELALRDIEAQLAEL